MKWWLVHPSGVTDSYVTVASEEKPVSKDGDAVFGPFESETAAYAERFRMIGLTHHVERKSKKPAPGDPDAEAEVKIVPKAPEPPKGLERWSK